MLFVTFCKLYIAICFALSLFCSVTLPNPFVVLFGGE